MPDPINAVEDAPGQSAEHDPGDCPGASREARGTAGIALSGGGVRSATFNLGLLQRLNDFGLLEKFDYLTTVSGGGYIGSWWSRFRLRQKDLGQPGFFPKWQDGDIEPEEIRHLRKFSNFIAPRLGMTVEIGKVVVTVLSGLVQSLVAVNAALAFILLLFAFLLGFYTDQAGGLEAWTLPLALAAAAAALIVPRLLVQRFRPEGQEPDRLLGRLNALLVWAQWIFLSLAGLLGFFWGIWWAADFIADDFKLFNLKVPAEAVAAGGALGASGILAYLTKRLSRVTRLLDKADGQLKKRILTPQILAYLVVILGILALALSSHHLDPTPFLEASDQLTSPTLSRGKQLVVVVVILIAALLLYHPRRIGAHAFYRDRLARTYLGEPGDSTQESAEDDVLIQRLAELKKPEHLICATANDIKSDTLHNYDRGAFHACFSGTHLIIGPGRTVDQEHDDEVCAEWSILNDTISLGSAMTCAAAAFNSVMGSKSKRFGPAVTLVLTALNLRLGLWVPNPARKPFHWGRLSKFFPGHLFFAEAFSQVACNIKAGQANRFLHLSDGGHFENLAVYELIRRECRYILVSDCGADPKREFFDFGNLARRVRVDFGVELSLDLAPLRPDEKGVSHHHVAVGSIRYAKGNYGILLYVKPSLTGDEPGDIQHYVTQNPAFPHESTGDQFYNEAQWEAYRRLGFHIAHHAFKFLGTDSEILKGGPARIFGEARWRWTAIPPRITQELTRIGRSFDQIQQRWCKEAPVWLTRQVFPEALALRASPLSTKRAKKTTTKKTAAKKAAKTQTAPTSPASEEMDPLDPKVVGCLIEILIFLEDLHRSTQLETYGWRAEMRGWRNIIQRWVRVDALRIWWPILRSLFGTHFVDYLELKTPLGGAVEAAEVEILPASHLTRKGVTEIERAYLDRLASLPGDTPPELEQSQIAQLQIKVTIPGNAAPINLPLGMLGYRLGSDGMARWHADHLFVLPGLWSSDWGTIMIGKFLARAAQTHSGLTGFSAVYDWPREPEKRRPLEPLLTLYHPHGFELHPPDHHDRHATQGELKRPAKLPAQGS